MNANEIHRKYILDFVAVATSLTDLTNKFAPNQVEWNGKSEVSFSCLKPCAHHQS